MEKETNVLPLIPLRGITIFPHMVIHFDVGREKSILALEDAMINDAGIFLCTQKDAKIEQPGHEDIYEVGTICSIKQILKLPGDTIRVLVEGEKRGKRVKFVEKEPFFKAEIETIEEVEKEPDNNTEALIRVARESFNEYVRLSGNIPVEAAISLEDIDTPGQLGDIISSYILLSGDSKQEILEIIDPIVRLEKVITILKSEIEILRIEKKIGQKVKKNIDKLQREYYLREQLKAIQDELGEDDDDRKEEKTYKNKINKAKLPKEVKEKALYELSRLKGIGGFSSEGGVIKSYLDWILELPWNTTTEENIDLKNSRKILDNDHYGLEEVKERIIEYLAVKKKANSLKGPILCLVGPPGVGKTSIGKSIARALNRKFVRMSLGGVSDEADIRGHRKTYVGAIPGRIIYGMKQAGSKNPLFLLDEIDKMSSNYKGSPADALLEVLDSEQNSTFRDHYLELDFDLSQVLFITTANSLETIPRPLLDRMEIIEVSGYTNEEKFHIAKKYLVPKQIKEHNLHDNELIFSDSSIYDVIDNYTRESGVRSLEREIGKIVRKAVTEIVEKNKKRISISTTLIRKYLGNEKFTFEKIEKEDKIGVVTGMAWTGYGGDTLPVEVVIMAGSGKLQLTGKLGDVMKESASAGYSYIRANAEKYGVNADFYKEKDIHIHVPEGAVPKDGPSAGVTMVTAMVSALSNRPVRHNVAMTGEITLTGRVLPIGGLKEKTLAAYRAGVDTIIIPKDNKKDLEKIPKTILKKLNVITAENIDVVLKNAIIGEINNGN